MIFKRIDPTNREDWLKWRTGGLGSSDAPVIMGVSRFKTLDQLLGEKTGTVTKEEGNEFIKERGNRIEPIVRKLYENKMGIAFPPVSCQNIEHPHLIASLDGLDAGSNLLIEIKLMTTAAPGKRNETTAGYQKWLRAVNEEIIPEDYYPQVQHQLMVTGLEACVFLGLRETRGMEPKEEDVAVVTVLRNDKYITELLKKSNKFWEKVKCIIGEKVLYSQAEVFKKLAK